MTPEQEDVITTFGDALARWNLPRATGRVYGYLLLQEEPSTSEGLRDALDLSAGAVSSAIRELVSWGLARTISQRGSRRLLVEAAGGFDQLLAASHERTRVFIRALQTAQDHAESTRATQRLRDVTDLFSAYVDAGERVLRERQGGESV